MDNFSDQEEEEEFERAARASQDVLNLIYDYVDRYDIKDSFFPVSVLVSTLGLIIAPLENEEYTRPSLLSDVNAGLEAVIDSYQIKGVLGDD